MTPFDGESYEPSRDRQRLTAQLSKIKSIMLDHQPHTLDELARAAECSTASASARVRDLRKDKFGGYTVNREYLCDGVFQYTLERESWPQ